jgi:hypothetical protein
MNIVNVLFAIATFFQYPHVCDSWATKLIYDPCANIDVSVAFCGLPRGNVIPYRIWVDNIQRDNIVDINRQKLVQLYEEFPSNNGLVVYVASHPISVPEGLHTVEVRYSDLVVKYQLKGKTTLIDYTGATIQCPTPPYK